MIDLSVLIYFLPFFITCMSYESRHFYKLFTILTGFLLFIIIGFRDNIGYDYHNYTLHYYNQYSFSEPLSYFLTQLTWSFENHIYFFSVFAFITILPIVMSSLQHKSYMILLLYICIPGFFLDSFSLVRQAAATSFCILMYSYLLKKHVFKSVICALFALFLHISSLPVLRSVLVFWC